MIKMDHWEFEIANPLGVTFSDWNPADESTFFFYMTVYNAEFERIEVYKQRVYHLIKDNSSGALQQPLIWATYSSIGSNAGGYSVTQNADKTVLFVGGTAIS